MLADLDPFSQFVQQGPLVAFALIILGLLLRGVLHTPSEVADLHSQIEKLEERNRRLEELAWRGTKTAEHGVEVADKLTEIARQMRGET